MNFTISRFRECFENRAFEFVLILVFTPGKACD
jgi:hypothetical protein